MNKRNSNQTESKNKRKGKISERQFSWGESFTKSN